MELIFATHNKNKVNEIEQKLDGKFLVKGLTDINYHVEIPEDFDTLKENAAQKAETIFNETGKNCFADDTGLEVDALNGAPGVFSARYAGKHGDSKANIKKLLQNLKGVENRSARFKTVICIILNGEKHFFEGIAEGEITLEECGKEGFGYDPIFKPVGHNVTFAEMTLYDKNLISHRAKAFNQMLSFLLNQ